MITAVFVGGVLDKKRIALFENYPSYSVPVMNRPSEFSLTSAEFESPCVGCPSPKMLSTVSYQRYYPQQSDYPTKLYVLEGLTNAEVSAMLIEGYSINLAS